MEHARRHLASESANASDKVIEGTELDSRLLNEILLRQNELILRNVQLEKMIEVLKDQAYRADARVENIEKMIVAQFGNLMGIIEQRMDKRKLEHFQVKEALQEHREQVNRVECEVGFMKGQISWSMKVVVAMDRHSSLKKYIYNVHSCAAYVLHSIIIICQSQ